LLYPAGFSLSSPWRLIDDGFLLRFLLFNSLEASEGIIDGYYDGVLARNALDNRGHPHVLDRFYTYQTNGVRFLDWFTAAVTGKPVEDVACVDCETPEYHWTRPAFPQ
jgi:hypothetical protein